ncbi:MAG: bifunctional (p)ppGpp synthetase/guanosine-3',5'-bis(diphosphate) 3'-pyrophosphohydrolase [Rhodoferax sp.]|nr:bifunctional (p)ppGpp synthetase/guanosine-3',5'-bis(diphosphate) 3'-pyrophosphohydrolase [Rhodoferax sp.]
MKQGGTGNKDAAAVSVAPASAPADAQLVDVLVRARAFAEPLLNGETLDSGENTLEHAHGVAGILRTIGGSELMQAAVYLVYACEQLTRPQEAITKRFGANLAALAMETNKLVRVQRQARTTRDGDTLTAPAPMAQTAAAQVENVRKMLLAFSRDLRVVMLRLASRLQTLRHYAATKLAPPPAVPAEALLVFAPLANRLGIWDLKWEIEDLAFRFLEPGTYRDVAQHLDQTRAQREREVEQLRTRLERELRRDGIHAKVQGRPKHIYSIVKKMRGKSLDFEHVYDICALRVIVPTVTDCYTVLSAVHGRFTPVPEEFDDYIAKPKPNGYRSLHTVVRDDKGQPIEIQIRTQEMHDHAEHGVAAHWLYKEAGAKGYAGVAAVGQYDAKIAVLRQLLDWERELSGEQPRGLFEDRIYVLTPQAAIVELVEGATPVDFAYHVHTEMGHRCRGARVDGAMVPLNTPLRNGQTVEIVVAKEGGPSRDWLNPELGYLAGQRARGKVRAWFNARAVHETVARGREAVEKVLQREGKTSVNHEELARELGFDAADALFEAVGKDEFSLRQIEALYRPGESTNQDADAPLIKAPTQEDRKAGGGVLVVGVDSLMTQLARCCKPAPPDPICGFVTRGKGVSVHRADCPNVREFRARNPERVIDVQWGQPRAEKAPVYPVDVVVQAIDRQGLLRDLSEVFLKEKMNVIGVQSQTLRDVAWMTFTVETSDAMRLQQVLGQLVMLPGIRSARRR